MIDDETDGVLTDTEQKPELNVQIIRNAANDDDDDDDDAWGLNSTHND
jgi:hypothetical protein